MDLMNLDPIVVASLYKPLQHNEFRLALLQPGDLHTPISVDLVHANITSNPVYDAISYVWGSPYNVLPICCDGQSTNVTVNLHWALLRARLPDRPRLIWADALCINQNDLSERGQQVALMGLIYSRARRVLACMGRDPDGRAAEVASLLADYGPILTRPRGPVEILQIWQLGAIPDKDSRWGSLSAVMAMDWFRRAWVLQEIGLAKEPRVMYGSAEFSYRDLMATVRFIRIAAAQFATNLGLGAYLIHTHWADWSDKWASTSDLEKCKFLDLLDHGALLRCQDPRDHIYAFLGHPLARDLEQLHPDYNMDKLELYKQTSILLLHDAGIRTLSSVEHSTTTINEILPSWVIRWDVGFVLNNIYSHPNTKFRADSGLKKGHCNVLNDVLWARGVALDMVEAVFTIRMVPDSMEVTFRRPDTTSCYTMKDLVQFLEDPHTPCAYQGSRAAKLGHALCCEPVDGDHSSLKSAWSLYLQFQRSNVLSQGDWAAARGFWVRMTEHCNGRALILTKSGLYGLASHIYQPGDICSVVSGSAVPMLMRHCKSNNGEAVKLVGEAYLHGFMQGEAAELVRNNQLVEQTFMIH